MFRVEVDKGPYEPKKTVKYPYIGVTKEGTYVMFIAKDKGVRLSVIPSEEWLSHKIGTTMDDWSEDAFTPLAEGQSLTLTNIWETADE